MRPAEIMAKLACLPAILNAAELLHTHGLQDEPAAATVKRYLEMYPELKTFLERGFQDQP